MKPDDSIRYIKGIGEKRAELFQKLGIFTVEDLLYHLPRSFEDRTNVRNIGDLTEGEEVCVRGRLASGIRRYRSRRGVWVVQTTLSDGTGIMRLTWFNASYISKSLSDPQGEYMFFGKVVYRSMAAEMVNPVMEKLEGEESKKMGGILPIYPATAGLNQRSIREAINRAMESLTEEVPEILPEDVRRRNGLMGINEAIRQIHNPEGYELFNEARRRLVFEEFLKLQLGVSGAKNIKKSRSAPIISDVKCMASFARGLPFDLTDAQKRVINEIAADLKRGVPMNRLVQGDVGSGKTVVAAAAMFAAAKAGYQSVMMVPTEILAEQHFGTLGRFFSPWGIKVAFLTGGQPAKARAENLKLIESGEASVVVGTHAVITDKVNFNNLALTVTDEQHRFGVGQRSKLAAKGANVHTLVMSATPIPRTLSLVIYGDLDISVIDELPPGRKPVKTVALTEAGRPRLYDFVLRELNRGRQAYFVCALVDESDAIEAKAAAEYVKSLSQGVLFGRSVGLLHGKMKAFEKEDVMRRFMAGEIEALVATTVIEEGVDVPNATIMVIENAERFGLSQLHQLRGRVGRGEERAYCVMFGNVNSGVAKERMKVMCETNDGFKISEKDLEIRGPGEFFGTRQHGLPEMKIGNLFTDMDILAQTQSEAARILKSDPFLKSPENALLSESIKETFAKAGDILN